MQNIGILFNDGLKNIPKYIIMNMGYDFPTRVIVYYFNWIIKCIKSLENQLKKRNVMF